MNSPPFFNTNSIFLSDGGLETWLIFNRGLSLEQFASFPLLDSQDGVQHLLEYYEEYVAVGKELGLDLMLSTATWRASTRWGKLLGLSQEKVNNLNKQAIELVMQVKEANKEIVKILVDGQIEPIEDDYRPEKVHSVQSQNKV